MLSSLHLCPHLPIIRNKLLSSLSRCCNHFTSKPNPSLLKLRLAGKSICAASDEQNQVDWAKGLDTEFIPKHVAVIMDGNRKWARNRGQPPLFGHWAGREAMKQLIKSCKKYGVKVLSIFTFSTENWARAEEEVEGLILFVRALASDLEEILGDDTCLVVVGKRSQLRGSLQQSISAAEKSTEDNERMTFVMAINYGGRYDVAEATREIARKVEEGVLEVEDICDNVLERHLDTNGIEEFPNSELLIRTSEEVRVSNFMLWQLAYTHMFFTDKLFPDFEDADLVRALAAFQRARKL